MSRNELSIYDYGMAVTEYRGSVFKTCSNRFKSQSKTGSFQKNNTDSVWIFERQFKIDEIFYILFQLNSPIFNK